MDTKRFWLPKNAVFTETANISDEDTAYLNVSLLIDSSNTTMTFEMYYGIQGTNRDMRLAEIELYDLQDADVKDADTLDNLASQLADVAPPRAPTISFPMVDSTTGVDLGIPWSFHSIYHYQKISIPLDSSKLNFKGLVIVFKFDALSGTGSNEGSYRFAFGLNAEATPSIDFFIGEQFWCTLFRVTDDKGQVHYKQFMEKDLGDVYDAAGVAKGVPINYQLIDPDKLTELSEDGLKMFRLLEPFSVVRQMVTSDSELGKDFLERQFRENEKAGIVKGTIYINPLCIALLTGFWEGVRGYLPFPEGRLADPLMDIRVMIDSSKSWQVRLGALAMTLGTASYFLHIPFEGAGAGAGAVSKKAVAKTAGESVELVIAETEKAESALSLTAKDIDAASKPVKPAAVAAKQQELKASAILRDLRRTKEELTTAIEKAADEDVNSAMKSAAEDINAKAIGRDLWNGKKKDIVAGWEIMANSNLGTIEKLTEGKAIYRSNDLVRSVRGREEMLERYVKIDPSKKEAVIQAVRDAATPSDPVTKEMLDLIDEKFERVAASGKGGISIDLLQLEHESRMGRIIDYTSTLQVKHYAKTKLYSYLLPIMDPYFLGFVFAAVEYYWRD